VTIPSTRLAVGHGRILRDPRPAMEHAIRRASAQHRRAVDSQL
jgi:hypothetical protein